MKKLLFIPLILCLCTLAWADSGYVRGTVPLNSVTVSGAPIAADGTTAPGIATTDLVPAIVWATNEVTPVEVTLWIPDNYDRAGTFTFYVLASSSNATTEPEIDWSVYPNNDTTHASASIAEVAVALSLSATTVNDEATLTLSTEATNKLKANSWATFNFWNTTTGAGTLEIKGFGYKIPTFDN